MATQAFTCEEILALDCIVCCRIFTFPKPKVGRYPRLCSEECRAERMRHHVNVRYVPSAYSVQCQRCDKPFIASRSHAKVCSLACRQAIKRVKMKARGYKRPPQDAYWALKRARKRSATVERVDPYVVFERDQWRCHICKKKTKPALRGKHEPLSPELDHIVPLSEGGEHSYRNTACSCRECNMRKGSRPIGQMLLFG
jgi:5-methylcytosine-specific restriction endonuclease McrA